MPASVPKTIEFKVDLIWKVVIIGLAILAGRLSWQAYGDMRGTLTATLEVIHAHETRISINEYRIQSHEAWMPQAVNPEKKNK